MECHDVLRVEPRESLGRSETRTEIMERLLI